MKIAGIITAAGLSSRMGEFKPMLEINGLPMIAHTVMSMKSAGADPVCVVIGYRGEEVRKALDGYDVIFAENENYASSDMLASIKLGLEKVQNSEGFFLLPGDMPLIPPKTFKTVSQVCGNYIVPTVNGKNAHPPLIKKACYDAILNFAGDGGLPKALGEIEKTFVETGTKDENMDADFIHEFELVSKAGKKALGLSRELCKLILDKAGTPEHIKAHCLAVGDLAGYMAKKLTGNGYFINILLCESAGNLHDIKRLEKNHAAAGCDFLKSLGYDAVSDIVGHHMTSDGLSCDFDEYTIVFLADKLVRETRRVTPDVRYAPALEKFPVGTETGNRIRADLEFANRLFEKYTEITGERL